MRTVIVDDEPKIIYIRENIVRVDPETAERIYDMVKDAVELAEAIEERANRPVWID